MLKSKVVTHLAVAHRFRPFTSNLSLQASRAATHVQSRSFANERNGQFPDSTGDLVKNAIEYPHRHRQRRTRDFLGQNAGIAIAFFASTLSCLYLAILVLPQYSTASTLPLSELKEPQHDISSPNLDAASAELKVILGANNISKVQAELDHRSNSSWSSHQEKLHEKPHMIVFPSSTKEVAAIMQICHRRRIPVTAYSGGTSVEGQYTPTRGGICIDFARMDKIVTLHEKDLDVVVQPAVRWEFLNEELAKSNLFFPPDPGPGAQIGGMVGTGCSGTNAYRYGTMREWVLSLTIVLADGTVIKTRQRPRKSSAGYDLTKLFIGSEGTLGLVTEAVLKVIPLPQTTSVAVASFPSIRDAADCVSEIVGKGVPVAAIEILDDVQMHCINKSGMTDRMWPEAPTLFFKFAGTSIQVLEQIDIVKKSASNARNKSFEFAKSQQEQDDLWSARKAALWSVMALRKDDSDHVWTGDVAVPISRLPDIIEETKQDLSRSGLLATIVGHVGDGNFHAVILYNDGQRELAEGIVHRMVKRAIEMEGTVTGEHGVGLVKRDYLPYELGETTVDAMRQLKHAFDPLCLLNCDKVVRMSKPKAGEVKAW